MKAPSRSPRFLVPLGLLALSTVLEAAPKCDQISQDVRKAVASDPAKTLMIVEDALVINEACACEIVTAAIEASKADESLKQQIVQTALAVAPKMAPAVTACVGITGAVPTTLPDTAAEGSGDATYSAKNGKGAKAVLPIEPPPPVEEFTYIPRDIRGIYLIAPGGVGFVTERTVEEVCKDKDKDNGGPPPHRPPPRRRNNRPISRSIATN
jgi:hypothetical protein